jgi:hypothetical protein
MPDDSIKTNAEIVAEKLAERDAHPEPEPSTPETSEECAKKQPGPTAVAQAKAPQSTVFQWLLTEVGRMEEDIRAATKRREITTDAAKVVFKECVRMMVETQAGEMQKQQEADARFREFQERQEKRQMEKAPFERPV